MIKGFTYLALGLLAVAAGVQSEISHAQVGVSSDSSSNLSGMVGEASRTRVLVGYQPTVAPAHADEVVAARITAFIAGLGGRVHTRYTVIPYLGIEVATDSVQALAEHPDVVSVQKDRLRLPAVADQVPRTGVPVLWDAGLTGANWYVALLDTGVDARHPALAGKVLFESCFSSDWVGNGARPETRSMCPGGAPQTEGPGTAAPCGYLFCDHGTRVAAVIVGNDGDQWRGMAPEAGLLAVQVFSEVTDGTIGAWDSDLLAGLEWVHGQRHTRPIAAVNVSLSGSDLYVDQQACDAEHPAYRDLVAHLSAAGIVTVAAAGNDAARTALAAPACVSGIISVAGSCAQVDEDDTCGDGTPVVAERSNVADFLDFLAPGEGIISAVPPEGYAPYSGSSMAAAMVTGAWTLLKQGRPGDQVEAIRSDLLSRSLRVDDTREDAAVGDLALLGLASFSGLNTGESPADPGSRFPEVEDAERWAASTRRGRLSLLAEAPQETGSAPGSAPTASGETTVPGCVLGDGFLFAVDHVASSEAMFRRFRVVRAGEVLTLGPASIPSDANLTLEAGTRVTLRPGVRVQAGARLSARVDVGLKTQAEVPALMVASQADFLAIRDNLPPMTRAGYVFDGWQSHDADPWVAVCPVWRTDSPPALMALLDFGSEAFPSASPDENGWHWNNLVTDSGSSPTGSLPSLVDPNGLATGVGVIVSSFGAGANTNGSTVPDATALGVLGISSATRDGFFVASGNSATVTISGLAANAVHRLTFFGSRDAAEMRVTRFSAQGAGSPVMGTVQTSGTGIGSAPEQDANRAFTAVLEDVQPTAGGQVVVTISVETGGFGYLGAWMLERTGTVVNTAPVAAAVAWEGAPRAGSTLQGRYVYSDADGDPESGTLFQWERSATGVGSGTVISGAQALDYLPGPADVGQYLRLVVIPGAAAGATPGGPVASEWRGPFGAMESLAVYHIGNSFTRWGDVPLQLASFAAARSQPHVWGNQIRDGEGLGYHWANGLPGGVWTRGTPSRNELETATWDALVLQPMSREFLPENQAAFLANADLFDNLADANGTRLYLYSYWPYLSEPLDTQDAINAAFENVRAQLSIDGPEVHVIPAGEAFRRVALEVDAGTLAGITRADLYQDDLHPSDVGYYLSSLVHYATIYQQSPVGLPASGVSSDLNSSAAVPIDSALAVELQRIAWEVTQSFPGAGLQAAVSPELVQRDMEVDAQGSVNYQAPVALRFQGGKLQQGQRAPRE